MSLTGVITIGNFEKDSEKLKAICESIGSLDLEVIFVMDTQSIESELVLNQYCNESGLQDFSILRHDKRNPGTGRNLGLSNARSDWVTFWDSDDLPHPGDILNILTRIDETIDVVIAGYFCNGQNDLGQGFDFGSEEDLDRMAMNPGIWRFITRREVAQRYRFPEIRMGEDQVFIAQILSESPTISFEGKSIYEYTPGTILSLTADKRNIKDLLIAIDLTSEGISLGGKYARTITFMVFRQLQSGLIHGNVIVKIQVLMRALKFLFASPARKIKLLPSFYKVQRKTQKNAE
jgi:glycosyltransferase involved in cell wall biosynthesis